MGTITVAVDGNLIFHWDGDEAEIKSILDVFPRAAARVGLAPPVLAAECVMHLSRGELLSDDLGGRQNQMMAIIWFILQRDTGSADHPGKIGAYAAMTDFDVDLHIDGREIQVIATATSNLNS
jgi:hypothetical protein